MELFHLQLFVCFSFLFFFCSSLAVLVDLNVYHALSTHPYISVFFLFFFSIYFQFIDLRLVFICSIGHIYIIRVVSTISDLHTMLSHRLVVLFQSQLAYTEDLKHPNYYVCQNKLEIVVEATNIRRF